MSMAFWKKKNEEKEAADSTKEEAKKPLRSGPPSLAGVKHIIAISSGKGGVGKSTLSANLAIALKHQGAKVALMDADIYGASQPGMFGARAGEEQLTVVDNMLHPLDKHGIQFVSMGLLMGAEDGPVVWRAPMVNKLIQQFIGQVAWGEQDFLLIDLPPGTGDIQLTLVQRVTLSGAVVVTTPQQVAMGIAQKGMRMFDQVNVPVLGVIENMSGFTCGNCGHTTDIFKSGGGQLMAEQTGVPFLGGIPLDTDIMNSGDDGIPVLENKPDSDAAKTFLTLAERLIEQVEAVESDPLIPQSIEINPAGKLSIVWGDGEHHEYSPYNLRVACACALCVDENTGKQILDPSRVALDIGIEGYTMTGRYALTLTFTDGHNTGIYTFHKLREVLAEEAKKSSTQFFSV
jgi:ATP-binding protein involved in chromosome partitioning